MENIPEKTKEKISDFLSAESTLTLATLNGDAAVHACDLFFVHDTKLALYFISSEETNHTLNVAEQRMVAVTVHRSTWDWIDIVGIQIHGIAETVPAESVSLIWELYRSKFKFADEFENEIASSIWYRIVPNWMRIIDNSVRFGYREEFVAAAQET